MYLDWFMAKVMNEVKRINISTKHFNGINENENWVTNKRTLIFQNSGTIFLFYFNVKGPVPFTEKFDVVFREVCATENTNED